MDQQNTNKCQNCEQPFKDGFEFCPHCGQKTNEDLTIGVLFYNAISNYFSFDARFLKSFIPLMFKPGYLASKFLEGKRLLYLHPAQMYLFISVIFFFLLSFNTRDWVKEADKINEQAVQFDIEKDSTANNFSLKDSMDKEKVMESIKKNQTQFGLKDEDLKLADSLLNQEIDSTRNINTSFDFNKKKVDSLIAVGAEDKVIYKEMGMDDDAGYFQRKIYQTWLNLLKGSGAGSLVQKFFDTIPIAMFFLMPLFALILKLFYLNKGRYAHHLVFSFYFFSFLFTVFSIVFAINRFIVDIPDWIDWLIALSTFFYFLLALQQFYKQHWILTFLKSGLISFIFLSLVLPMAFVVLVGLTFMF
ncbi:DUF3667 domain-containing protein [Winogradskyella sp. A3E31]|uniref:DUF3667 domain-containing protein n=1 Tax=Winogradskyella sp. A3E31 TaxID=3349637 RepID=UPI00398B97FD